MSEALGVVRDHQIGDGTWPLDVLFTEHIDVSYEAVGAPSRWITLRTLRVLRWVG